MRKTLIAAAALAITLFGVISTPAHAGAGSQNIIVVTAANMNEVFAATIKGRARHVFVEVCPSARTDCQEEVRKFALTSALAKGGWLGPDLVSDIDFYAIDPTPDTLRALAQACAQYPSVPAAALCQVGTTDYPLLVMYKTDGTKSEKLIGPVDDSNFAYMLRHFVK